MTDEKRKDLILEKDTVINGDLKCCNIRGKDGKKYNLTVKGDIHAWDIDAENIHAWKIDAWNIDAENISYYRE